jgi:prepilin-type processing-associated H-X9-DG protein
MSVRFRLMDVLVTAGVALALLTFTAAARRSAQDAETIAGCASNLQRIGQGIVQYGLAHDGAFPRTRYDPRAPISAYTGAGSGDPYAPNGPQTNDVTAAAFLVAREMRMAPKAFICPAALQHGLAEIDTFDDTTVMQRSNFVSRIHYNYSLANMYPDAAAVDAGYSLEQAVKRFPRLAIGGDTNPGGEASDTATTRATRMQQRMTNSPNHQRDGQNILFADGSVQFYNEPFVGVNDDNVYASAKLFPQPGDAADSVLLPTWSDGPKQTPTNVLLRRWVLVGAMIFITALMGYIIVRNRYRGPSPTPPVR